MKLNPIGKPSGFIVDDLSVSNALQQLELHGAACIAAKNPSRLAVVGACDVLDTPAEEVFESLAKLAAQLCNAPVALVTVLDTDRQWFKARVGADVSQTPLSGSLCVCTLLGEKMFVVEDALNDPRTKHNDAVTGPMALRAYLGHAIEVNDERVGTLCVFDTRSRPWSTRHKEFVQMLAAQASALLSARITNRALQQAQESMRLAMDTQTEMLARLDADLRIVYANSALAKHLGLGKSSLLGRRASDFSPECERAKVIEHFEEIRREKKARTTDQTMVGDDGRVHTHRWTDSPVFNDRNEIVGFQSWGWDISDLCDREAALKSAHAGLLSANKELTARNAEILQLTYALTHDLQTPLATLTGQLTLLDQALRTGFSSEKPISRMRSSVDRLTHMLTDLMAYARAGQEQTRREPINLGSLAKNLVDEIAPVAAANGVLLSFDQHGFADASSRPNDLVVIGDRDALHRSICNLISNATKYTAAKPGGDKHVRVRLMQNDERVRLCIIDTGLGIPPAMLEEVFLPFKRISRDSQGTGLGLSIVKKYIELFGGKVWLESDGRNGTTAVVEFKRQAQSALAA